ncbi:efflux RND transporter permease subunit [Piscirickettsia salmonis]|uniref:efflux RND transporter permease subunit n=1 Tax=Piscirickettsia salmonis TaxID=1238 RepID=UPI0034D2CE0C
MMTSLAFILGVVPLALASGAGGASQRALGVGVIGGMLSATLLGVIFVPTFFVVVLGLFKTKPRLLGAELRAFEEEQAAKKAAAGQTPPDAPAQPNGGQEGKE